MEASHLLADVRGTTRAHRRALMRRLPDGLVLLTAAREAVRNGDVHHPYRQSSDFLWLTGVESPGYAILLDPRRGKETLFVPRLTQKHAVWLGHIPSREEARQAFGIRDVRYSDELVTVLRGRGRGRLHADHRGASLARSFVRSLRPHTRELREALDELRLFKDAGELALLARASAATAAGHLAAMRAARPGVFEYQVQAEMERAFKAAGCPQLGYGSIVAGGRNSAVLHYVANDR